MIKTIETMPPVIWSVHPFEDGVTAARDNTVTFGAKMVNYHAHLCSVIRIVILTRVKFHSDRFSCHVMICFTQYQNYNIQIL